MKTRSPRRARAAPIPAVSSSGVAEVCRWGSGDWSRNMMNPQGFGAPIGGRCGQPGRPARGCRPRNGYVAGYLAGTAHCSDVRSTTAALRVLTRHPMSTVTVVLLALAVPYFLAGPHFLADDYVW